MFKIYSSSAGSGKTYTLTKEYLKLALHSNADTYFRHILAVTFTNAAANEMKERIMRMLRLFTTEAGRQEPMFRDVVTELYEETRTDDALYEEVSQLIAARAELVFQKLLHRYSDFAVMTIDKFTQRLVSSFTDELGIPFGFETQVDSDLLASAVDRLLARIGQEGEEVLTRIVETYYLESVQDGKSWGALPHQIRAAAGDLLNEQSYLAMVKVADLRMADWVAIRNQLKQSLRAIEDDTYCKVLAREAIALIEQAGLTAADFAGGSKGIAGHFEKFDDEKEKKKDGWWSVEATATILKTINEGTWYGGKANAATKTKVDAVRAKLEELYECIESHQVVHRERYVLFKQLEKHLYNLSLLGEIRTEFDLLLRQNNQVHISDFNRRVLEIVAREPVPFIFERLGEKYHHILVDEFQDTSKLQFANLLPLLDNALAAGYFNLIVGDAKQSIYRFRGGDMDLILHLSQDKALALGPLLDVGTSAHSSFTQERLLGIDRFLTTDHLRTNRRSFREITEFNNQFFAFVARQLTNEHPMVGAIFDEHFQQEIPPQVPTGGHVQLEFLEMNTDENEAPEGTLAVDAITRRALELIEELRASGYHWRDIAILCRKKNEARTLANALREKGYPLISEDSLSLAYARSVSLLVAFMKVLHTSDNRLARYEAAYLFHQVVLEQVPTAAQHEAIRSMCAEKGLGTFVRYFGELGVELNAFRLRQLSVYELCEQLITSFRLFEHQTENAYLFRFLDVVLDFGTRRSNHLGDFLTYWESAKDKLSITIPANADALRITTIHRSKGLEYPVVIVPYAHWSFTPNPQLDRLWVDLEAIKNQELALAETTEEGEVLTRRMLSSVVSVVSDLDKTGLKTQYQDEKTRTLVENLNLLYVAFTRPIQRMYLLARQEKDWNKYGAPSKVSRWLYDYLGHPDAEPGWQEGQSCYVLSPGSGPLRHAHRDGEAIPHRLSTLISTDRTKSLRLRRLAERIFDVDTFEKKKDHLQKVRHALSLLPSAAELPTTLRKLTTEGIVEKHEARTVQHTLEKVLALDKLRPFFDPQNQVVLQRELLLPGGKMLRADRTATLPDGSVLLALFVAGSGNDDARRQLRRLVQAYRDMGAATVRGYLVLLETGQLEWVE